MRPDQEGIAGVRSPDMPLAARTAIEEIVDRIVAGFDPLQIYVFGSHARGTASPDSDIDLLVVLDSVTDRRAVAIDIRRALVDLPYSKDIIVTTPDEIERYGDRIGSILRPALREGMLIYAHAV